MQVRELMQLLLTQPMDADVVIINVNDPSDNDNDGPPVMGVLLLDDSNEEHPDGVVGINYRGPRPGATEA